MTIEELAIAYHKSPEGEGEYGCNGLTCPGVQRLIAFGRACVVAELAHMHDIRNGSPNAFYAAFDRLWAVLQAPGEPEARFLAIDPVDGTGQKSATRA